MEEDGTLVVNAVDGLLSNDLDPDGDPLAVLLASGVSHGNLDSLEDGSFTYLPSPDFHGLDSFTYVATDSIAGSNVATVTIMVRPVNDAPVGLEDSYRTDIGTVLVMPSETGVLANDFDVDGDSILAAPVATTSHGVLALEPDGSFTYVPDEGYAGDDTFSYTAGDGELVSDIATTIITVSGPPVAAGDFYTTDEDTPLRVEPSDGVLANDEDINGDRLTANLVTGPRNGFVLFFEDGAFTYEPAPNFNGQDFFVYTASDGSLKSAAATTTITVRPVVDRTEAVNDEYVVAEDVILNVTSTSLGVLSNDLNFDTDSLTLALVAGTAHGSLVVFMDGTFSYTPEKDFHGTDTFTYIANNGIIDSNVATGVITVTPVNDAPLARDDFYIAVAGSKLNVTSTLGILSNDEDADGDPISADLAATSANGTLVLLSDGSFSYDPNPGFTGTDTFTYIASDGAVNSDPATVTITVGP